MIRADMISTVGRAYLTSNIENDEYSYPKAFSAASLTFAPIQNSAGRRFEKLDIRFVKDNISVLIETKQNFTAADEEQLSAYVEYEKALTGNKIIAILANTINDNVKVWRGVISDGDLMPKETALRTMDEYVDFYTSKINDKEKVMQNTYKLNEMLHRHSIPEKLRSQFVGTCLLALKNGLDYSTPSLTAAQIRTRIKEVLEDLLNSDINKAEKLALLNRNVLGDQYVRQLNIAAFREILKFIEDNILPFINDKSTSGQDLLNLFFVTFNKYVGKSDKNQAFTPDHVTDFMAKITGVNKHSVVLDPCCGSGSFLVRAMTQALDDCATAAEQEEVKKHQIFGMKDGKFIGARTPYGYLKAEDDCHQLIIDPVAAVVVQRMFRWASEGAGLNTIAVRLNEAGVLTPSHYKKMQGKITHANLLGSGKWQTRTVGVILRSEVYTGDLVQGQTKTVDHRQIKADAEEWTVVRDTHEAIISREQFAAVQEILNQTASRAKAREVKAFTPNLLKGKVFCAHCGGSLHRQRNIRKKSDDVYFYHCLSQSRISKNACPGVTIREDALLDMLADMLQDALDTVLGQYTLSLAELPRQAADRAELREKITSRKQEIQRLRGIVRSLYENLVQGVLTKDEYFDYKEKYESRITDLSVEMEQLEDGLRTMDTQIEQHRALEQDAAQIKTDRGLTGALIERLIDRIEVSHDKQITVRYRFQSEFETYAEVLEQCRNM